MSAVRASAARVLTAVILAVALVGAILPEALRAESVPRRAEAHRRDLLRAARYVFGPGAPVAVLAAQVHAESAWNHRARSTHADGLAQFTPATAAWIAETYPGELAEAAPLNPVWALLALCRYDRHLYDRMPGRSSWERWAFTMAAYNGGPGWIPRDRALAARCGADPNRWFGQVEGFSSRSEAAFRENRAYPRRILIALQPLYRSWGPGVAPEEALP